MNNKNFKKDFNNNDNLLSLQIDEDKIKKVFQIEENNNFFANLKSKILKNKLKQDYFFLDNKSLKFKNLNFSSHNKINENFVKTENCKSNI